VQGVVDVAVFALVRLVVVALIAGDLDPLVVLEQFSIQLGVA
jgi:hypothetical protein